MFSYFAHCIYSSIQLSSCKCVLNKLSCHMRVADRQTERRFRSVWDSLLRTAMRPSVEKKIENSAYAMN